VDALVGLQVVKDRIALAAYRQTASGTRAILGEHLRRGVFTAKRRADYTAWLAADPHQAFCIISTVDPNVVWVRDFSGSASLDWSGAQGDGVTDDAPFINAMLQNPFVSCFRIEDGRKHLVSEPIKIRRAITLTGAGMQNSLLIAKAPIDVIEVALPSASENGLRLADFGITNLVKAEQLTAGSGISLNRTYLATVSNISITGGWDGLSAVASGLVNIDGLLVKGCRNAGLLFNGGHNFDLRVSRFTLSDCNYAIRLQDMCDELIFTDGVCSVSRCALYADATSNTVNGRPEFCRFSRVSFDSCDRGLDLANCADFVFDACFVSCRPNHGAELGIRGPVENIQFIATTFFFNGKSAAVVGPQAAETDFLACKFVSNGTTKPNAYDTLTFAAGCGTFSLSQNRFKPGWNVAGTPRYQVRIENGGAGNYSLIGNHFSQGGTGALLEERRGADRVLIGNIGI